jgi:hypothetical protein
VPWGHFQRQLDYEGSDLRNGFQIWLHYCEVVKVRRWDLVGGRKVTGGISLEGICCLGPFLYALSCFLTAMMWATPTHTMIFISSAWGQSTMDCTLWNREQNKSFLLLICSVWYFGHSYTKVTNTTSIFFPGKLSVSYRIVVPLGKQLPFFSALWITS